MFFKDHTQKCVIISGIADKDIEIEALGAHDQVTQWCYSNYSEQENDSPSSHSSWRTSPKQPYKYWFIQWQSVENCSKIIVQAIQEIHLVIQVVLEGRKLNTQKIHLFLECWKKVERPTGNHGRKDNEETTVALFDVPIHTN